MSSNTDILLFSYGTLQLGSVQLSSFGRLLEGEKDALLGFRQEMIEITDEKVLAASNQTHHPIVIPSASQEDQVEGMVFAITQKELEAADAYEVADYKRVLAPLRSGKKAWVYIKA